MSYQSLDDSDFLEEIELKKEFYIHKDVKPPKPNHSISRLQEKEEDKKKLVLQPYQVALTKYINPNTPYKRLLVKWETGMGKTKGSIAAALNFVDYYIKELQLDKKQIGSVFIIGFSEAIFKRELVMHPEFGYVSRSELDRIEELRKVKSDQNTMLLLEIIARIKRRISDRSEKGFFKFYGYRSFFNRIFNLTDETQSNLSEHELREQIQSGKIQFNKSLLAEFKYSILICDEVHVIHNTKEKNNWGIAIQAILDHEPTLRGIFMSATPINNSASEVVDVANLLLPPEQRLSKKDIFADNKLTQKGSDTLKSVFKGKVTYLRNIDPDIFPDREFVGESIDNCKYLKFVRLPLTPPQYDAYKKYIKDSLPHSIRHLLDFAFPHPNPKEFDYAFRSTDIKLIADASLAWKEQNKIKVENDVITGDILQIKHLQKYANKLSYLVETMIDIVKNRKGKCLIADNTIYMSGVMLIEQCLLMNGFVNDSIIPNDTTLCSICGKYMKDHETIGGSEPGIKYEVDEKLQVVNIVDIKPNDHKELSKLMDQYQVYKITISHENAKHYATEDNVLTNTDVIRCMYANEIQITDDLANVEAFYDGDVLKVIKVNGITYQCNNTSACSKKVGGKANSHAFQPAKFFIVHSNLKKKSLDRQLEEFNFKDNAMGKNYIAIIGAEMIHQSIDLNCIQHIFVMNRPDNIPTLKQIIGRGVRNMSHKYLPKEMQKVNIYLLTSCLPKKVKSLDEQRYLDKLKEYEEIQKIEKIMHEYAFDASIFYDIMEKEYVKAHDGLTEFSALKYKPVVKPKVYALQELDVSTYNIYYAKTEVQTIQSCIKQLFLTKSQVYKYDDLWYDVKHYPYKINMRTDLFEESNFKIALYLLCQYQNNNYIKPPLGFESINSYAIQYNDQMYAIFNIQEYYILSKINLNSAIQTVDIESCYRFYNPVFEKKINLNNYLTNRNTTVDYQQHKIRFKFKYQHQPLDTLYSAVCDFGLEFHKQFIEDIIKYVFTLYTFADSKISENHEFYFKMLYYYDLIGVIFWASTVKSHVYGKYTEFLLDEYKTGKKDREVQELKNTLDKTKCSWCPQNVLVKYNTTISKQIETTKSSHSNAATPAKDSNPKKKIKTNAELLPVGYILGDSPKFYHPVTGWLFDPEYVTNYDKIKENNIMIGYDEKTENGIHIMFKIRSPVKITKTNMDDKRRFEKGGLCLHKSKLFLENLLKRLGGKLDGKSNITNICTEIKAIMIKKEIEARQNKTNIKWFYFYYEKQPNQ